MTADRGPAVSENDLRFMKLALALAARGQGQTGANPNVGCVLVQADDKGPRIVGRGVTAAGGRPHAETVALAQAGAQARGATAFVTLEPCAHQGQTPPCAEALIAAGVARAVCALDDPDPRVNGKGFARLREAGIEVVRDVLAQEARAVTAGFLSRLEMGRPLVTLKLATSLDGRIAVASGDSRWITGEAARARGHLLRARHDAILVGSATVLADDPELTCRLPGLGHRSPLRVVMDGRLRTPIEAKLVRGAGEVPTLIVTRQGHGSRLDSHKKAGVEIAECDTGANAPLDPAWTLRHLSDRGINAILVEGGAALATAFWRAGLVDRLVWFRAPVVLGGDGRPALDALELARVDDGRRLRRTASMQVGADVMDCFDVMAASALLD